MKKFSLKDDVSENKKNKKQMNNILIHNSDRMFCYLFSYLYMVNSTQNRKKFVRKNVDHYQHI